MSEHPIQPIFKEDNGTVRFKANVIVRRLLDTGPFDMNDIATWDVTDDDRRQFAQLIGYSLGGYSELMSYVDEEHYQAAAALTDNVDPRDAQIAYLRETIQGIRRALRPALAKLYEMHPDDFGLDQ